MKFTLQHKDPSSQARAGELQTDHGVVKTPIFMPVGTAATVKGIFHRDVRDEARAQIILANTYHLYLRPGMDILERAGGVHRFSTWDGPMLTDSGGFQVFSLAGCRKLKEEGCHFAHRRLEAPLHARKRDRHGAYDRRRYHDGLRRVSAGRLAA